MKIIRRIYSNFDRIYRDDKLAGWLVIIPCHTWVLSMVIFLIGGNYGRALDCAILTVLYYLVNVLYLDRRELRAELARLRADSRP